MPQESNSSQRGMNGDASTPTKGKKANTSGTHGNGIDASEVHELLQNRIAALEGEKLQGGEEDKRSAEEAKKNIKGMNQHQIHGKYIDLYQEFKRQEREHAKEKQKNKKEADASKNALTSVQKLKSKTEAIARDMQKQNKDLREHIIKEEQKRLKTSLAQTETQLSSLREEITLRSERERRKQKHYNEMPDIVVKVVCRYRAELFFKISRKTKLQRLFGAWTDRMELHKPTAPEGTDKNTQPPPTAGGNAQNKSRPLPLQATAPLQFLFTHLGRAISPDQTPEDAGMEDGDEILAIEMMDLTGPEVEEVPPVQRALIMKQWTANPDDARKSVEDVLDGVVKSRLKHLLHQYELRERHFDAVLRARELDVMIWEARTSELKQQVDALEKEHAQHESYGDGSDLEALQKQNDELMKKVDEQELQNAQARQRDYVDQLSRRSSQFLAAAQGDPLENIERTLEFLNSLREELNAQWGIEMASSGDVHGVTVNGG